MSVHHASGPEIEELQAKLADLSTGVRHLLEPEPPPTQGLGLIARALADEFKRCASFGGALHYIFNCENRLFGRLFFGTAEWAVESQNDHLLGKEDNHCLAIVACVRPDSMPASGIFPPEAIVLHTDFRMFCFRRANTGGQLSTPFRTLDVTAFLHEVAFTGSLWASTFPTGFGIITRTVSCSFPSEADSPLFEVEPSDNPVQVENAARLALNCFHGPEYNILSLEEARKAVEVETRQTILQSEQLQGAYVIRRYAVPRSVLFDFGTVAEQPSRGDVVTTYQIGDEEFHREFLLWPNYAASDSAELRMAAFNLLHMLAIRRTKLFRNGFASRVYNVLLPPLTFAGVPSRDLLAVFPCANLYRTVSGGFRRTVSVTFIVVPLRRTNEQGASLKLAARALTLRELHQIKRDLLCAVVDDDTHANRDQPPCPSYYNRSMGYGLPALLRGIFFDFCDRFLSRTSLTRKEQEYLIKTTVYTSLQEAKIVTLALTTNWRAPQGYHHPWERWLAGKEDPVFRSMIFRTLFHDDFLEPSTADASLHAVRLESLNVGNTLGIDMAGMTLFNPQDGVKLVLYPAANERFPNHSIIRWITWQIYIDSALTAMRAMLYNFEPVIDKRAGLGSVIDVFDNMLQEFVELYDLDIRDYSYRKEYQKLRELIGADAEYSQLAAKFAAAKEVESLREQRLINKLLVAFTVATVTITIFSTAAQMGQLSFARYVVYAIALSTVLVWLSYHFFDPLRQDYSRISKKIKKEWNSIYGDE